MSHKLVSLVVPKSVLLCPTCILQPYNIHLAHEQKIKLTLSPKMTTSQAVKMSVTVNKSPIQDYDHPDDHAPPTYIE